MDSPNISKKSIVKYKYSREYILSLRLKKACQKWPTGLNKCCLNGKGFWDPFQSYKSNSSDPNFNKSKDTDKETKPRIPLNERDREIVLGPQKRSWDAGCHVIQRKSPNDLTERTEKSSRGASVSSGSESRLGPRRMPDSSGRSAFQEGVKMSRGPGERPREVGGRYDDYNYRGDREPSNRFYNDSSYRGRERKIDRDRDRNEYENAPNRGFRRADSSYEDRDREDHRSSRGFNERSYRGDRETSRGGKFVRSRQPPRQQTFNTDVVPEWMSEGPSTVNETIELTGIKEKDGMQNFKKMEAASSDENEDSDEFDKEDMEECEELHNLKEGDGIDEVTPSPDLYASSMEESDISKESQVNKARGSRFRNLFMSTADSNSDIGSRDRDAQLFDLIKGGGSNSNPDKPSAAQHSASQHSAKEMEIVLKDILFKKQPDLPDSSQGYKGVKPPLNLSSCNVRTVDDIESSMTLGSMSEGPDNKGAGDADLSVFTRLLGMVQNAASNAAVLSNTQSSPQPVGNALPGQSAANKQSRLPAAAGMEVNTPNDNSINTIRQRQQLLNALNGSSSHALTTAALIRQQQLQAGISGDNNQSGLNRQMSNQQNSTPQPPGQALSSHSNTANSNSPVYLGQNNKSARNAEQIYMALRAVNNHSMTMQYDTNAVAASARINQLQNSDQVFNQNNVTGMQAGKVNIPTVQSQLEKEIRPGNYYDNGGIHPSFLDGTPQSGPRPLTKMHSLDQPPLDYQSELMHQTAQMSLQENMALDDNPHPSRLVRPIVKTIQPSEYLPAGVTTPSNAQQLSLLQRQILQQRRNQSYTGAVGNPAAISTQQYSTGFAGNSATYNINNAPSAYAGPSGITNYQQPGSFKPMNYPGASFGMGNMGQDVNKTLLLQQMLIQRQLEAKSAAIQMQHRQQKPQHEIAQSSSSLSGLNSNNNNSNSSLPLSQLFNMQNKSASPVAANLPPLPSRDSNAVKTLDELEG